MSRLKKYFNYGLAGLFVFIWTLLRFYTHTSIYDLITQQLVARAWLHGNFNPITLGTTHYVLKIILLYIPVEIMPGSPRLKLILLTLIINLVTFYIIARLIKKILKEFEVDTSYVPMAVLWLSMIAGSAFWISFANSRNLEVAGGLYLIYCVLISHEFNSKRQYAYLALFAGLLFFADTLQIYMTALPLLGYIFTTRRKQLYKVTMTFIAGFIFSKFLFWLASRVLHITFNGSGIFNGRIDPVGAIKSTITLFAGSTDVGWPRVVINILFIASIVLISAYGVRLKKLPNKLVLLVICFVTSNEVVYILSGQAHQSHTSRYLIMLLPIMMMVIATVCKLVPGRLLTACFGIVVCINAISLGTGLVKHWDTNFDNDKHIHSVANYLNTHRQPYAYASMDTALPLAYYNEAPNTVMAALACAAPKLVKAKSVPVAKGKIIPVKQIPIILDNSSIANSPFVCTSESITKQFGPPVNSESTDDGSLVLYYSPGVLQALGF